MMMMMMMMLMMMMIKHLLPITINGIALEIVDEAHTGAVVVPEDDAQGVLVIVLAQNAIANGHFRRHQQSSRWRHDHLGKTYGKSVQM